MDFTFTASVERLLVFLALISVGAYVLEVEFAGSRNSLEGDRFLAVDGMHEPPFSHVFRQTRVSATFPPKENS
jgi:hypothetical protein